MKKIILFVVLAFLVCAASAGDNLIVHEWGTFTSLQDEEGNAIGGINTDDEPVPNFVHRLAYFLLLPPTGTSATGFALASKGITPKCHPDVTMRLETPVLYFYPPAGWKSQPVDVHVAFPGGWLSEFYPDAISRAPGFDGAHPDQTYSNEPGRARFSGFGHLKPDAVGELSWNGLALGAEGAGPETTEKVWLAPRNVKAATVKSNGGEIEKFLFYRGVANTNASVRIVRSEANQTLGIFRNDIPGALDMINADQVFGIHAAWLVDVNARGEAAFKSVGRIGMGAHPVLPASFNDGDFLPDSMPRLKKEMRDTLINEGLFADEADALLKTWEISYFKSPGLRFFYLCPRIDIDNALPLKISVPGQVTRVMIGRIEIVTPEQRALLKKIADPATDNGSHLGELPSAAAYRKLGRFRNALILDEQKRRPTAALDDFIRKNALEPCKIE